MSLTDRREWLAVKALILLSYWRVKFAQTIQRRNATTVFGLEWNETEQRKGRERKERSFFSLSLPPARSLSLSSFFRVATTHFNIDIISSLSLVAIVLFDCLMRACTFLFLDWVLLLDLPPTFISLHRSMITITASSWFQVRWKQNLPSH